MGFRGAAVLAALVGLSPLLALAQGHVEGVVTNGTSSRPVARQEVKLLLPRGGMQQVGTVATDARGHFAFSASGIDPKSFYLLSTEYQGVAYNEPAKFDSNGLARVNIKVYDASRGAAGIQIPEFRVLMAAEGARARVQEDYEISNPSQPPRAYLNDSGTLRFRVPQAAGAPSVSVRGILNMPIPQTPEAGKTPGEYSIRYPLKPGVTLVTVSYELDYTSSGFAMSDRPPYPVERASLFVYPANLTVEAPLFKPAGEDTANNIQKLEAATVPSGAAIDVTFSGESGPAASAPENGTGSQPGQSVEITPNSITSLRLPIAAGLLLLLLWALGVRVAKEWPRWKERRAGPAQKKFGARVEALLNSIADLDELFAGGNMAEKNYWKERLELKAKLVAILKKSPPALLESYAARHIPR